MYFISKYGFIYTFNIVYCPPVYKTIKEGVDGSCDTVPFGRPGQDLPLDLSLLCWDVHGNNKGGSTC